MLNQISNTLKLKELKTKLKVKSGDILNKDELVQVKGGNGDERDYVVIINGQSIKIYI